MSAKFDRDGKAELELRSPLRNESKFPTEEEVAACRPCRIAFVVIFTLVLVALLVSAIVVIATSKTCGQPMVQHEFWRKDTFYQIYLPSFKDSSGDGFGDITGLKEKLSYFEEVGVKVIVLSGLIKVGDFRSTRRQEDKNKFKDLVAAAKNRGISIFLAFDPTYSSKDSTSFKKSRENKYNKFRSWYHWRPNVNNWRNQTGLSAWQFDPTTNESYYTYSNALSPALNYNNSEVFDHLKDSLTYWLNEGARGFQLFNFQRLVVDGSYQDNPAGQTKFDKDLVATQHRLEQLHSHVAAKDGFLIGALEKVADQPKAMRYFGTEKRQQLDMVANSYFTETLQTTAQKLQYAEAINNTIVQYQASVPKFAWPSWLFGGPKFQRLAERYSSTQYLWLYIILQLSLPGCPIFYYGDELGLKGSNVEAMAWDSKINGGFTTAATPWYSTSKIQPATTLEKQRKENGTFAIFKSLNQLRVKDASLHSDKMTVLSARGSVIIFHRFGADKRDSKGFIIALNFGNTMATVNYNNQGLQNSVVEIDTLFKMNRRELGIGSINLQPLQGLVLRVLK